MGDLQIWRHPLFIFALLLGGFSANAAALSFPEDIPLPNGFRPDGIVRGYGTEFFVGSLADGRIYKGDLRSGDGAIFVEADPDTPPALGLSLDRRTGYLFVAGGPSGSARVYDTSDGSSAGTYQLADPGTTPFVNDVVVTRSAAYFTDSFLNVLYRLPLSPNGELPGSSAIEIIPLVGDCVVPLLGFGANGIDATQKGDVLVITHTSLGIVCRVDPQSGSATQIDLGGNTVDSGDGVLLSGNTLYVVQAQLNQIAVIDLAPDLFSGVLSNVITNPNFRIPTTLDEFGNSLYAVNARFDIPPEPDTEYNIVKLTKN
jgi:hypothetical protein